MNTQDIPDNELDKLFRDSAKRYNSSFEEGSWQLMDKRLSARDKNRRFNRRLLGSFLFFAFLFSSVTGYYLYDHLNQKKTTLSDTSYLKSKKKADEIKKESSGNKNSKAQKQLVKENTFNKKAATIKKTIFSTTISDSSSSIDSGQRRQIRKKDKSASANNFTSEKKYPLKSEKALGNVSDDTIQVVRAADKIKEQKERKVNKDILLAETISKNGLLDNKNAVVMNDSSENDREKGFSTDQNSVNETKESIVLLSDSLAGNNNSKNSSPDTYLAKASMDSVASDTLAKVPLLSDTVSASKAMKNKEKPVKFRRYSIGVLASPDFSSIGFPKLGTPGIGEGFFIEYHLTPRWTICAGVIKTFKKYSGDSSGYKSTEGFWKNKNKIDRIDGSCNVLDVPLNIKYHFLIRQKNLLFTSLGMSSYFMLNEQYSFISANNTKTWKYSSKKNYYFSIINISLGYERIISKSFSVQAEPYVKIPLKDIGEGDIKLFTAGLFLSLKYNIR